MKTVHAPQQPIQSQPETMPQPSESWGGRVVRRIGVVVRERVPASTRIWNSLVARREPLMRIAPMLVVAFAMLFLAYVRYHEQKFYITPGLAGFADINTVEAKRLGISNYGLVGNPVGYDGQFFFFMSYKPSFIWSCAHDLAHCPALDPSFRWQRILYPAFARALALGRISWIPFTLLLVNFVGVLVVVYLVGKMAVEMGASRWMGVAAGLFCGELLGFLRDLADPFGVLWIVVAIYL
ncbi:MAG: hypothetical protein ACRDHE_16800, partial [Ktedonobacterales bacterium]